MSSLESQAEFFKALAHPSRLLILGLCRQKPRHTEEIAAILKLSAATVSHHLALLQKAGILETEREQYYQNYRLKNAVLEQTIATVLGKQESPSTDPDPYRAKVLRDFFKHGRLTIIPAQRKKREVVLEKILSAFEPNRDYKEAEVNQIILEFHEDFATLRRELVGLGWLTRAGGIYRRVDKSAAQS
jgi:ArsR family transcriptional regulator, arsenate/arsenite/antimonite-responsive transcriptional repressor